MRLLLKGAEVFTENGISANDISISGGKIQKIAPHIPTEGFEKVLYLDHLLIIPGFSDVHVHLREPGFSYKETIDSGTMAAARAGYTALCAMPNLNPPPDSVRNLGVELDRIVHTAHVHVYPYGTITKAQQGRELSDMEGLRNSVVAFSDDGVGVQDEAMMRKAMQKAASLGKIIAAHTENDALLSGGFVHQGKFAKRHGYAGIPSACEWTQIKRDLALVEETGCRYHVCHISTKESVALIAEAKAKGLPVTCETAPHYLLLCDEDIKDSGDFKMNPPIRAAEDKEALIEGIKTGVIDTIATDHAPHTKEEKEKGLKDSVNGIVGLETAFPVLYTKLVKTDVLSLEKLLFLMCIAPRRIFGLPVGMYAGAPADLAVLDLTANYKINPDTFYSKGKSTPFTGWPVSGENIMTFLAGKQIYCKDPALTYVHA